jgi:hypothetical protein
MPFVWASLALAILLATIGVVVVFRRGLAFWRDLKRVVGALATTLDELNRKTERTATRAETLATIGPRAEPSTARLRTSLARLAVLRAAVRDVQDAAGRVTAVYPRK